MPAIVLDKPGEARLLSFKTAFRQRYGIEADLTAAEGYDAARLLVHLLGKTTRNRFPGPSR